MSNQTVKVNRDTIAACMTCPLCDKLFRDATTIIECLHTFCRKCIYEKLSDEELECCPICNIDLGCVPVEKLSLQDVRTKIFPYKRRKVQAPEVVTPVTLPAKRKERSLSSLVVGTPRVSIQSGMTGRRSKSVARKASRGSSFTIEKPLKKDEDSMEDHPESSSSPETLNKFSQNNRKNSTTVQPSSHATPDSGRECGSVPWEGKGDPWKPLNCLVEAANRSKSSKFTSHGSAAKSEAVGSQDSEGHVRKTKSKEHGQKSILQDGKNSGDRSPLESVKPKKMRKIRQKKAQSSREFRISPQAVLDAISTKGERRNNPIWFSLVAADDRDGDSPLPQISASYLRIKDGSIPVSFIQKYLMRKLDLTSEDEVEIKCMGKSVVPTLQLNNLVDLWLQTASSEKVSATIGSSASDFVMILSYARRAPAS
ncbi:E3 ubiquitin protein ligase DRIP2-like isoform X2 [Olea europaea var. sylvestris]|uniref:E3 ubiquitin ligase DRIP2-like n=1 Tax=Olea europaea subsp. europaea TaxID=158383 RepID=A0A8S0RAW4_OLEEU|nr:E3 ubiquitin protein ligase DRIP2-like isoform X2 [Olea europaea var. sylvestris]CAA2975706.1 E3 ubiquitin ligase DRIP2-like [Olea europaea subsp. europaea]